MRIVGLAIMIFAVAQVTAAEPGPPRNPGGGVVEHLVLAPANNHARNSEGDFIRLKDGRILFVYSRFTDGNGDDSHSFLAGRVSPDDGATWSDQDQMVLPANTDGVPTVSSVSLLRLKDGRLSMFYLTRKTDTDRQFVMRTSQDEGKTWSNATVCTPGPGYVVVTNSRVVRLKSGRIMFPAARHELPEQLKGDHRGIATCYYSDDEGNTWRECQTPLQATANSHSGFQYPAIAELRNGRLIMLMAMHLRPLSRSYSSDGGQTWSPPTATDLATPVSPPAIRRIPSTGDLLLIWNDHTNAIPSLKNARTPLTAAISQDEGQTWTHRKMLYSDRDGSYQFTAIEFVHDRVLLGLCAANKAHGNAALARTVICTFDLDWLYH